MRTDDSSILKVNWVSWLLLALIVIFWGSSFSFVSIALQNFSPAFIVGARITLAAICVGGFARIVAGPFPPYPLFWVWSAAIGFCALIAPFSLYTWAQEEVPSGVVAIYISATPLFVTVLAHIFVRERMSFRGVLGFFIGFGGVAVMIGPGAVGGMFEAAAAREAAALAAAFFFAVAAILVRLMPRCHPLHAAAGALIAAAVMHAPATGASLPTETPAFAAIAAILTLGVLQTGVLQVSRYALIKRSGAVFASQASFLLPIWAVGLGWWLLGERLIATDALGMVLILAGLAVANSKTLLRAPGPPPIRRFRKRVYSGR